MTAENPASSGTWHHDVADGSSRKSFKVSRRSFVQGVAAIAAVAVAGSAPAGAQTLVRATSLRGNTVGLGYGGLYPFDPRNRVRWAPALQQLVHKTTWAELEPTRGQYDLSSIRTALSQLPAGVMMRLHVEGGNNAPAWLADVSGPFVNVSNSRSGVTSGCGRYWDPAYQRRHRRLCNALGAAFDAEPRIVSINMAGCSLIFDEPWILGGDAGSVARLSAAGLTADSGRAAMMNGVTALANAFPTTVMEFPAHSHWAYPDSAGKQKSDWVGGRSILNDLHTQHAHHIIITDYGLGPDDYTAAEPLATAASLYGWMHQRSNAGFPVAWQLTAADPGMTPTAKQLADSISCGIRMGARWIEHSGYGLLSNEQVQDFDARLRTNTP